MMAHIKISSCDGECALVNHCRIGGVACAKCGKVMCAYELDEDGLCDDCAVAEEENENETEETK